MMNADNFDAIQNNLAGFGSDAIYRGTPRFWSYPDCRDNQRIAILVN